MTKLQAYTPFKELWNLSDEVGRLFWGLSQFEPDVATDKPIAWAPSVDVSEGPEDLRIHAELPGLKREDVKINIREGVLTFSGEKKFGDEKKRDNYYRIERGYGSFARSFSLPNTVDIEKIRASMKDGVLEIVIPKKPEAKPKEIQVEVS